MERADLELLEDLKRSDYQLRKLHNEHLELEQKLKKYQSNRALTANDIMAERELKKQKLRGMDSIMTILNDYRQAA